VNPFDRLHMVLGANSSTYQLLTSKTRMSVFDIARTETMEKIEGSELRTEMLQAIDLLEKQFTRKQ